jgi:hypothetical protein
LLHNSVRNDKKRISELLDEHFKEYTSSGKVYSYQPGDTFGDNKEDIVIIESSFEVISLSSDIALVNYQTIKNYKDKEIKTNRSSIWKKSYNKWIIVFHQGTIITE